MTKALLLAAAVIVFARGEVQAGLDLTWGACPADGGTANVNVSCESGRDYDLVGTFQVPTPHDCFVSMDLVLDFQVENSSTVSPFWHFEAAGCNRGGISLSSDPRELQNGCSAPSPWDTTVIPQYAYGIFPGPNTSRLLFYILNLYQTRSALTPGQTYYAFHIRFHTINAVEAGGNCAGCRDKVAILWKTAQLVADIPPLDPSRCREGKVTVLDGPGLVGNCATWNGASVTTCGGTPVKNRTWGMLKALYR